MASGYWTLLAAGVGDGPTNAAASAVTVLPVTARVTLPPMSIVVGTVLRLTANGRISNVVTTPGTVRLDFRIGGAVVYDTGALTLNQVAKTTLPWWFDCLMICRAIGSGTSANVFGFGKFKSEAIVASPLSTVGGSGDLISASASGPGTAPAVGAGFDSTISNTIDFFHTQTVATGSFTVHNFMLESGSVAGL